MDIDIAISKAMELNSEEFVIRINIFELDGGEIYSACFNSNDTITHEKLKDILINRTQKQ